MGQVSGAYFALLLTGFFGSLGHCLGMCGPLVMMLGTQYPDRGLAAAPRQLLYHGSRISVYAFLGAVVGGIGSLLGLGSGLSTIAGAISLALGAAVVFLGFGYIGWLPLTWLMGRAMSWKQTIAGFAARKRKGNALVLGALNGLLPCGLVYSSLLAVSQTGGLAVGALAMLAFGAGTVPAMLTLGLTAGEFSARTRMRLSRVAGFVIVVVGLQLIVRGLAVFGLVPHAHLGPVMLW